MELLIVFAPFLLLGGAILITPVLDNLETDLSDDELLSWTLGMAASNSCLQKF